ncbi:glycosyltransferase [Acinetobacter terrestris]|uniref:glycosyltransferase n=1 Tax=Acinetobacter terrestris TaxID=2529843 RepID=UPI00103E9F04|nr:glycosyltransferase [Acinetobacter terrestris]TCB65675.1 glycosyltransferase [Acinetobacter terrestris]
MFKLSVIIPFRCENNISDYLFIRLKNLCEILPNHNDIEFLVVDSGSSLNYSESCKKICKENNIRYLFEDTRGKPFSLGGCRDFGVENAEGKVITFLDVDLRMAPSFWDNLLNLIKNWGVSDSKSKVLAIPCLYLSEEGTREFNTLKEDDDKYHKIYLQYLKGNKDNIESFAACSSVMIVDRFHYLSIGGHNPEFNGHGYEDFDLYHRLMIEDNVIPRADNYLKDTKNWVSYEYSGFRSQLSILGRPALMMNIIIFHLWHPRPKKNSFYDTKKLIENRKRIFNAFTKFDKDRLHPQPLVKSDNLYSNVLFFGKKNTNAFNCLRDVFPHLGNVHCVSEYDCVNNFTYEVNDNFFEMLRLNNIRLILFPNPYGNESRLKIYNWCRQNNFPYLVFERGALPNSWFFDPCGFNSDSKSYKIKFDGILSNKKINDIKCYINNCLNHSDALEIQGVRLGGEGLRNKLNISNQKILFVPLQRPSDTVIKYFSGDIEGFDNFINIIDRLAGVLKTYGWVTLVKKHPLEVGNLNFCNAKIVNDDTHFLDLLEACEASALINSGVGMYSMMMSKPCYIFGNAFYEHDNLNYKVLKYEYKDDQKLNLLAKKIISSDFKFDQNKAYTFIDFLVNNFYSFGDVTTSQRIESDSSKRTITKKINFYDLKINNKQIMTYLREPKDFLSTNSPLFERFGLDILQQSSKISGGKQKTSSPECTRKISTPDSLLNQNSSFTEANKQKNPVEKFKRKLNKLRYKPYDFFKDAKNSNLRRLRVFFE